MPYNPASSKEGGSVLLKLVRIAILVVLSCLVLSLVIAVARPETGILEKVVLVAAVVGLIAAASPARRIGAKT
jgi:uncharacterized membrane protein